MCKSIRTKLIISGKGSGRVNKLFPVPSVRGGKTDPQVSRIYNAEWGAEDACPFIIRCAPREYIDGAVMSFIHKLEKDEAVRGLFGEREVSFSFLHSAVRKSTAIEDEVELCARDGEISGYEVMHETAHALQPSGLAHHGTCFASLFLFLVKRGMPTRCYKELKEQFGKYHIAYNEINEKGVMYGKGAYSKLRWFLRGVRCFWA